LGLGGVFRSSSTITVVNTRKLRWAGHVDRKANIRRAHRIMVRKISWKINKEMKG